MQPYAGIYLLQNHCLHVSGVHRTHHQENIKLNCSLWYRLFLRYYDLYQRMLLQFYVLLMTSAMYALNM